MNKSHTCWEEQISDILPCQDDTQTKCMHEYLYVQHMELSKKTLFGIEKKKKKRLLISDHYHFYIRNTIIG